MAMASAILLTWFMAVSLPHAAHEWGGAPAVRHGGRPRLIVVRRFAAGQTVHGLAQVGDFGFEAVDAGAQMFQLALGHWLDSRLRGNDRSYGNDRLARKQVRPARLARAR